MSKDHEPKKSRKKRTSVRKNLYYLARGVFGWTPAWKEVEVSVKAGTRIVEGVAQLPAAAEATIHTLSDQAQGGLEVIRRGGRGVTNAVSQGAQRIGSTAETQLPVLGDQLGGVIVAVRDNAVKPAVNEFTLIAKGIQIEAQQVPGRWQKLRNRFRRQRQIS